MSIWVLPIGHLVGLVMRHVSTYVTRHDSGNILAGRNPRHNHHVHNTSIGQGRASVVPPYRARRFSIHMRLLGPFTSQARAQTVLGLSIRNKYDVSYKLAMGGENTGADGPPTYWCVGASFTLIAPMRFVAQKGPQRRRGSVPR